MAGQGVNPADPVSLHLEQVSATGAAEIADTSVIRHVSLLKQPGPEILDPYSPGF
jgi:hypothetical protein